MEQASDSLQGPSQVLLVAAGVGLALLAARSMQEGSESDTTETVRVDEPLD
jgi:hypothetical protein